MIDGKFCTVKEASRLLQMTCQGVRARLRGQWYANAVKLGVLWLIPREDLPVERWIA